MTQDHPSLAQQIEAVDWAVSYVNHDNARGQNDRIKARIEALRAAVETLKTLEFTRETAR